MKGKRVSWGVALFALFSEGSPSLAAADDAQEIVSLTREFCNAMVAGDLTIIDRLFDLSPENVFYDINEGPLDPERLKRVWRAATTNYKILSFDFVEPKVTIEGDRALQTGSWRQTQQDAAGASRDIVGRATILWKKTASGWKVYHYHASITPPRQRG